MNRTTMAFVALATIALAGTAEARDQIRIAGSSTVYPFTTTVAERFGKTTKFKTPVVESTGTGGGFKLFCQGPGVDTTDINDASRAIKKSEVEGCAKNGVKGITEIKIGYDGIVIANSKKSPKMKLTRRQLFLALAKVVPDGKGKLIPNPYKKWSDIDPSLPDNRIEVLGPPPTSGTRDAFDELGLEGGCKTFPEIATIKKTDKKKYKAVCQGIREDGAYIEAGENDVLIVRKLEANPKAFGVFGFSFLDQNADKIQGSIIDGVADSFENIASGKYPLSRPLFIYVKLAHVGVIPGIKEFVKEYSSERAWGPDGYLVDKGLIPMPDDERKKYREIALTLPDNVGE